MASNCSLDSMLKAVLAVFNVEQSMAYPPFIYDAHFNAVTSLLLSKVAEVYPSGQTILDIADPFVVKQLIAVTKGFVQLPSEYRNLLGSPQINAKKDGSGECGEPSEVDILKSKCRKIPLVIIPQSEFAERTRSTYDAPDYSDPVGYFSGKKQITVCPFDLAKVEVLYLREEKQYRYGYITQPDDTFIFDANNSVESEWTSAAFEPLFKGLCALYAAYSRDPEIRDWNLILHQIEIL